jgi:hypothetical protein
VFAQVPTGPASGATLRPGNLGRNALRSPGLVNVDFSLSKSFAIRERYRFQIRAEAFNALNHTNLLAPIADVRNSNFGRILSTADAVERALYFLGFHRGGIASLDREGGFRFKRRARP